MDDPDASNILHHVQETVGSDEFAEIQDDIFAVRAPPEGTYPVLEIVVLRRWYTEY